MRGAAEVCREPGNGYWLPNTEQCAAEIEARVAAMRQQARYLRGGADCRGQAAADALSVVG